MPESWRLKLNRAEHHLQELEAEICRYANLRPYRPVRRRQPKGKRHMWTYTVQFTREPDPKIALIVGDAAHNIRTALDHLAVAMSAKSERGSASFPVEDRPIWETGPDGTFIIADDDARDRFKRSVAGMTREAIALVKELQPYNFREHIPDNALRVLSIIDNADKHREITALRPAFQGATAILRFRDETLFSNSLGYRDDGAEIGQFDFGSLSPRDWPAIETEVQVEIRGSLHIAMKIADVGGPMDVLELRRTLAYCRDQIVPSLEKHVRA